MSPVKSPKKLSARDIRKKDKILFEKVVEKELPPGWKMDVKTRKNADGKKRDRYYTDPVTGYIFRSLTDVQRYLKTGKLGRHAKKPNNTVEETDEKKVEVSESKEQMVVSSPLSETLSKKRPLEDGSVTSSDLPQRASKRLAGVTIDAPPPPPPSPPEAKTRKATRLSGIKIDAPPPSSPPEPKTRQAGMGADAPQEPKTRKATTPPPPPPPSPPPEPKTSHQETKTPVALAIPKEKNSEADVAAKTSATQESLRKVNKDTPAETAAVLPPVSHEEKPPPPTAAAIVPPQELPVTQESSINLCLSDFWTDPCIEFAVKTLTGGIPFGDLNKGDKFPLELEVPMEELWTDPCIEFAVKTLTGAIPVGGYEHSGIQGYSHHQPTATSDMGINFCQTGNNNNKKQLDSVGQKSGNIGFHQQVNGNNGQCSRPRFFQ